MYRCVRSYIGELLGRQLPITRLLFGSLLLAPLAGCAGMGVSGGGSDGDATVTGSITPAPSPATSVNASDWAILRRSVAEAATATREVAWSNPETGSSGTLALGEVLAYGNGGCRPFTATVNDSRGIRGYRGEACPKDGDWYLLKVAADDDVLQ